MSELVQITTEIRRLNRDYLSSPAGDAYLKKLNYMIDEEHRNAEQDPDKASHFTSRSSGIRLAMNELKAIAQEVKKK